MDRETQQLTSLRLSRVLEDIGVSEWMITRRREMWLMEETLHTLGGRTAIGQDLRIYNFGSQSEGSTTLGMNSDVDFLYSLRKCMVVLDLRDCQPNVNFLVIKNERIPPQHCYLQVIRDIPLPFRVSPFEIDSEWRVLLKHDWLDFEFSTYGNDTDKLIYHGPSRSFSEKYDFVGALPCATLSEECQFLFRRPRPGHWPKPETLAKARMCPSFLVPQGYHESEHNNIEWRFSTSLIERLLVFDFTTTQMKVYTLLKMIRKTFIKPIVGDRLSTFHLKTAMMFTIESYPPDIWREDQIIQCAIYCLTTLCRWLKLGYSPHFTISRVNLFVGKLNKHERHRILKECENYIDESLQIVFSIEMDDLGSRMINTLDPTQKLNVMTRNQMLKSVWKNLVQNENFLSQPFVQKRFIALNSLSASTPRFVTSLMTKIITVPDLTETGSDHQDEAKSFLITIYLGTLASTLASECIGFGQPISMGIFKLYKMSFDTDLLSSRLKFASMLYRRGQYVLATYILSYCESLLGSHVLHICTCGKGYTKPSDEFADRTITMNIPDIFRTSVAHCVTFTIHERSCVPAHLVYAMSGTMDSEDNEDRSWIYPYMDSSITIDSEPFLYYLQYLTYRQLNHRERTLAAFQKLNSTLFSQRGHRDTFLTVLAHCYEMENMPYWAKFCYRGALNIQPRNSAANGHLRRLS